MLETSTTFPNCVEPINKVQAVSKRIIVVFISGFKEKQWSQQINLFRILLVSLWLRARVVKKKTL